MHQGRHAAYSCFSPQRLHWDRLTGYHAKCAALRLWGACLVGCIGSFREKLVGVASNWLQPWPWLLLLLFLLLKHGAESSPEGHPRIALGYFTLKALLLYPPHAIVMRLHGRLLRCYPHTGNGGFTGLCEVAGLVGRIRVGNRVGVGLTRSTVSSYAPI